MEATNETLPVEALSIDLYYSENKSPRYFVNPKMKWQKNMYFTTNLERQIKTKHVCLKNTEKKIGKVHTKLKIEVPSGEVEENLV